MRERKRDTDTKRERARQRERDKERQRHAPAGRQTGVEANVLFVVREAPVRDAQLKLLRDRREPEVAPRILTTKISINIQQQQSAGDQPGNAGRMLTTTD